MDYQSINKKKENFRKYLEKGGVIDAITNVLVQLYEERERPENPLEYIRNNLGTPSKETKLLKEENEKLKKEVKELKKKEVKEVKEEVKEE